jgi:hypothetical protein
MRGVREGGEGGGGLDKAGAVDERSQEETLVWTRIL